jgi:hypothetical protein
MAAPQASVRVGVTRLDPSLTRITRIRALVSHGRRDTHPSQDAFPDAVPDAPNPDRTGRARFQALKQGTRPSGGQEPAVSLTLSAGVTSLRICCAASPASRGLHQAATRE